MLRPRAAGHVLPAAVTSPPCAGLLVGCDGTCLRSFHLGLETQPDGSKTWSQEVCNSMGMSQDLARFLEAPDGLSAAFKCPNCLAGRHQCFVCKREGWSTHQGPGGSQEPHNREVYNCTASSCGRFYHPACINKSEAECGEYFLWWGPSAEAA